MDSLQLDSEISWIEASCPCPKGLTCYRPDPYSLPLLCSKYKTGELIPELIDDHFTFAFLILILGILVFQVWFHPIFDMFWVLYSSWYLKCMYCLIK